MTSYRNIAMQLRWEITEQREPGEQLPTQKQLAHRFASTKATVRRALGVLEGEGLVNIIPGAGIYVALPNGQRRRFSPVERALLQRLHQEPELGTTKALAVEMTVSQSTMYRALHRLLIDGLVHRRTDGVYVRA